MKWYFAGRVRHRKKILEVAKLLENLGESVTSDWIYQESLKPYAENLEKVQPFSRMVVQSLLGADVFVLISDPEGTDMFVELGVCLAKKVLSKDIKIYILGEHSKRSLMQNHPDIIHVKDLKELFDREKVSHHDFILPEFDSE